MSDVQNLRITVQGFLNRFLERHRNRPDRPFCFLLGAGASKPSRIDTGEELVQRWLRDLHVDGNFENLPFEQWATAERLSIPEFRLESASEFYPSVFDRKFPERQDGYAYLEDLMEGKQPSYGYSVLAHLLSTTQHKVVLTTNFDNLVADALSTHSEKFPRVVGNDELVHYVLPELRRPLIAKIHGDLGFAPKNRPKEVGELPQGWCAALARILGRFTPIVIGYSGSDGSLMGFLEKLDDDVPDTLFWCYRRPSPPGTRITELVRRKRGALVEIEGFDEIMMRLLDALYSPDVPDLAQSLAEKSTRRLDAFKSQTRELGEKLAATRREGQSTVASSGASTGSAEARPESQDLLEAASRVLPDKSTERPWWQWQVEIDREIDPNTTEAKYLEALAALPRSAPLLGNFALFQKDVRNDEAKAEEYFERALSAAPEHANNLSNYANFLRVVKRDQARAEEVYERALKADPEDANILSNYAVFLEIEKRDGPKAEEYYERALRADPENENALVNYADFLDNMKGDVVRAEEFYRRAMMANPHDATNLGNYARLLFALGRMEMGFDYLTRAAALRPRAEDLRVELAFYRAAHVVTEWPEAVKPLKTLISAGARSAGVNLSRNCDRAEQDGHAEPKLLRAIAAVISDDAQTEVLDRFPTWRAA